MKKNISKNINYFVFSGTLFIGLIIGLFFPDIDQSFQNLLGHRSIITHSILFPYLLYHYLIKKKKDPKVRDINLIIGIFLITNVRTEVISSTSILKIILMILH